MPPQDPPNPPAPAEDLPGELDASQDVKVLEVAPPVAPPGQKLTQEERLTIENLYLKLQNCQLQVQALDNQKGQIIQGMRELQADMEKKRAELSLKYGVDISRNSVAADGTIMRPAGDAPASVPRPRA